MKKHSVILCAIALLLGAAMLLASCEMPLTPSASGDSTVTKGEKGDVGPQGPQGEKGDTGEQGPKGEKGAKGDTGATGAAGAKGDTGAKGETGVGISGVTIDENGHLIVSYTNGTTTDAGEVCAKHPHEIVEKTVVDVQADCTSVGRTYVICETCGEVLHTFISEKTSHVFDTVYSFDTVQHWRSVVCGHTDAFYKEDHTYDDEGVCTVCGYDSRALRFEKIDEKNEYRLVGFPDGLATADIPAEYQGWPVTEIAAHVCDSYEVLTTVVIPDTVKTIGDMAFWDCRNLQSVTIGSGVETIGDYAFGASYKLIEVCNKSALPIVAGSQDYGDAGFYAMRIITDEKESAIREMDGFSFYNGPDGMELLGYAGRASVLTLPMTAPDGTYYKIHDGAFRTNDDLVSVRLPEGVTGIGWMAFGDCVNLTSVTIPSSLAELDDDAFYACAKLQYNEYLGGKYLGNERDPYIILMNGKDATAIYAGAKFIGDRAFRGSAITSIEFPVNLKGICRDAFSDCRNLQSVTIPYGVKDIRKRAFECCDSLESVTIPSSVTSIDEYAFTSCKSLQSITIPASVTSIGESAFDGCGDLENIYFSGTRAAWNAVSKGEDWNQHCHFGLTIHCLDD